MAKIAVEMSGDEAKLYRSFQKIITQQTQLQTGLKKTATASDKVTKSGEKTGRSFKRVSDSGQKAFGSGAIGNLAMYAAGIFSITKATQAATRAYADMAQTRQAAGERLRGARMGMGSLAQLAIDPNPAVAKAKMGMYSQMARKTYAGGGGDTLGESADLVFSIVSAGMGDKRELFTRLKATGMMQDPGKLSYAVQTLQTTLGKKETGTTEALIARSLAASAHAPAKVEQLMGAAAKSGVSGRVLGLHDEELLAAVTVIAKAKEESGGADTAGTYMSQMMRTFRTRGMKGTMAEMIQAVPEMAFKGKTAAGIQKAGGREAVLKEWFGRAQGAEAWGILHANAAKYAQIEREVSAAGPGILGTALGVAESVPEIRAANQARRAKAIRELGETKLGTFALTAQSAEDVLLANMRRQGLPEIVLWGMKKGMGMQRGLMGDEGFLRDIGGMPEEHISDEFVLDAWSRGLDHAANKLGEAADKMKASAGPATLARPDRDPK